MNNKKAKKLRRQVAEVVTRDREKAKYFNYYYRKAKKEYNANSL